jgi:hypothetical protein
LATSLLRFPFLRQSKLVARKQGRYAEKASAGEVFQPEIQPRFRRRGGLIGRPAGRPYNGIPLSRGEEGLARPTQEMKCASWFLRVTPLLSGRATPEIQ